MRLFELQQSIADAPQEFYLLTLDGRCVWANERAERSLGTSLVGRPLSDVTASAERLGERQRALRAGDLKPFETTHRSSGGELIDKEVRAFFVTVEGVEHLGAFMRDARPHAMAHSELQNLSRLSAVLTEVNRRLVDARDDQTVFERVCEVATGPSCCRMAWVGLIDGQHVRPVASAGASRDYLDGLEVAVAPEDLKAQGPTGVAARTGKLDVCPDLSASTRMMPWRDQAMVRGFLSSVAAPLRRGEVVIGTLSLYAGEPNFITDSERLLVEHIAHQASTALTNIATRNERDELRRQLELSRQLVSVGRLAASVGHDFNNLLAVILGNAESALHALPANSPARAELEEIQEIALRSARLTRQLLKRARGEEPIAERVELARAVTDALPMLQRLAGTEIALTLASPLAPGEVPFSSTQLDQVLTNLVVNAREAMRGTGRLTLSVRRVELAAEAAANHHVAPGAFAALSLEDDGPGVPHELQRKIFEPFFTTRAAQGGTGLGLATVATLVKDAGGFVTVESSPGAGARFTVMLPIDAR